MADYTPNTEQVRIAYMYLHAAIPPENRAIEFDRWLAKHENKLYAAGFAAGYLKGGEGINND